VWRFNPYNIYIYVYIGNQEEKSGRKGGGDSGLSGELDEQLAVGSEECDAVLRK
jgi:hypothetical protein